MSITYSNSIFAKVTTALVTNSSWLWIIPGTRVCALKTSKAACLPKVPFEVVISESQERFSRFLWFYIKQVAAQESNASHDSKVNSRSYLYNFLLKQKQAYEKRSARLSTTCHLLSRGISC